MSSPALRIGDLAERTGVSVSAIRFYEGKGLLEPDARVAGQRRYTEAAVRRLQLVAMLRRAGLGVADVSVALDHSPAGAEARREGAARRAEELREQVLTTLSALVVVDHVSGCHRDAADERCIAEVSRRRDDAVEEADRLLARLLDGVV